jgi:mRNA interferase MazF
MTNMTVRQGEIYWIDLGDPVGSEPVYRHPHLVVQNDAYNTNRIDSVVVCSITGTISRAEAPGNVLLDAGEAGLSKSSVVNISHIFTVDKSQLEERIGAIGGRVRSFALDEKEAHIYLRT